MGFLDWETAYDPFVPRLILGGSAALLLAGTYTHEAIRQHSRGLLIVYGEALFGWFLVIAYYHRLGHEDVIGLLPCAAVAPMLVATRAELAAVTAYAAAGLGVLAAVVVDPLAPPLATTATLVLVTVGLGVATLGRARSERALAELNHELEERVAMRTRDLRTTLEHVEHVAKERAVAEARAQAANKAKSMFLASMSHELRTPLNAIIGYTQMVREDLPPPQADLDADLERVEGAAGHLLGLIDDVLDLSRIEAERLELALVAVELERVVQAALPLVPDLETPQRALTVTVPPIRVRADADRLRQIVVNLLSNAAKFTPHGAIELGAEAAADASQRVRLWVRDTGIGIPKEAQDHIFDRFRQADQSYTRQFEGTGLGLAICRELVERMDGVIEVESEEGSGSTFTVWLPAA